MHTSFAFCCPWWVPASCAFSPYCALTWGCGLHTLVVLLGPRGPSPAPELESHFGTVRPRGHCLFCGPPESPPHPRALLAPQTPSPLPCRAESPLPGVQAVLPAEGILHREPPVVEFQGRETAFIQAHHLPVAKGTRLGTVPWQGGGRGRPHLVSRAIPLDRWPPLSHLAGMLSLSLVRGETKREMEIVHRGPRLPPPHLAEQVHS